MEHLLFLLLLMQILFGAEAHLTFNLGQKTFLVTNQGQLSNSNLLLLLLQMKPQAGLFKLVLDGWNRRKHVLKPNFVLVLHEDSHNVEIDLQLR